jgi:hypothetical protein
MSIHGPDQHKAAGYLRACACQLPDAPGRSVACCRVTVANLILEYILANAAVVRGYVPYFALLVGRSNPQDLLVPWRGYQLDW